MVVNLNSIRVDSTDQIRQNQSPVANGKKAGRFYKFASTTSNVTGAILGAPSAAWNLAGKITGAVVRPVAQVLGTTAVIAKEATGVGSFQRASKEWKGEETVWMNAQGKRVSPHYKGKKHAAGIERSNVIVRTLRTTPEVMIGAMVWTATNSAALKAYSLLATNEGTLLSGAQSLASNAVNLSMSAVSMVSNAAFSGAKLAWDAATLKNITNAPSAMATGIEQATSSIANNARYTTDVAVRGSLGILSLAAINMASNEYLKAADSKGTVGKLGHGIAAVTSLGAGVLAGVAAYSPGVLAGLFES